MYVNTISKNTTNEVNITYRLYMWISSDTVIGNNNQDYTLDEWNNVYASIKVKVSGDFEEKKADEKPLEEKLIATAVSYLVASSSDFSGGLVAINTDGTLYDETDSQQEIREYRYTGTSVNNYIFLDTDGDGEQEENEIWRIVGIFKNSNDEWNLKLLRNTVLTSDEIPETYTYDGTSYILKSVSTSNKVYWNYDNKATNYTDWTTSTLQYWLNGSDGYFGTLSSSIQNIIDTDYTYYLGGIKISEYDDDTTISAYTNERDASNIWSGNSSSWNGSIALLYPSDYGYSYNSKYWNYQFWINQSASFFQTGWIFQNISEWLLSPIKNSPSKIAKYSSLSVSYETPNINEYQVRPVLNLISNFGSLQGSGTESEPYKII